MLVLYTTAISANGRKPLALARHLRLDVEVRLVNVYRGEGRTAEYLKVNPLGKVPALVDHDFVLWESNAILCYLAEPHGDFALSSREPRERADILRWMFWEAAHWQPALTRVLAPCVARILTSGAESAMAPVAWNDPDLTAVLNVLESKLGQAPFVCGDRVSIADFSVAGMTTYFERTMFPAAQFPAISSWLDRMARIPAWASTLVAPWLGS